ncbi:inhibitor of growth protein 4-like isoform X2 [Portunus trituberculatus]|uniref:inhibitor of growth protein 4-like isoform X2 n=1 Tax=Portunus trituberculatus TaxID=210409 RepID=UPI001E1D1E83|nr:inhibitor of growth protein 4-like isoform X2 [Portunus trituberculatus]
MYSGAWCGCRPRTRQLSGRLGRGTCGGRQPASRSADFSCERVCCCYSGTSVTVTTQVGFVCGNPITPQSLRTMESLENLPTELQRNFYLMRDLDQRSQDVMRNIDQVDKHIRRLDSDLAKFEAEIKEKALNNNKKEEETNSKKRRKKKEEKGKNKRKGTQSDDGEAVPKTGRKKKKKLETDSAIVSVIPCLSIAHPSDVLDMPVDPNEPTYCLCHQVSYGEMIACDKMDCPIEWFHFACVGLTTKPKGKWYCPKCSTERKKK